jgi:HEAT repeat protein
MAFWKRKNPIDDLLERMTSKVNAEPQVDGIFESDKTVSWRAFREAEKINDASWIPQLVERIQTEKNKKVRDAANFVLGKITKNTSNPTAVQFLIDRAYEETDRHISASIYGLLAEISKPKGIDISTLKLVVIDEDSLVRHAAIRALGGCSDPEAEDILISISDSSDDPFDIIYANATLNKFGTPKAIPVLEKHLRSRKRDVRDSAKYAIEEIRKRELGQN